MENVCEKIYNIPSDNSLENLLFEYKKEFFNEYSVIHSNDIFKLKKANLNFAEEDINVYLLEFKILGNRKLSQIINSLIDSKNFLNNNEDFHYFFLRRIGYYKDNDLIYTVYLNNENKLINLDSLHKGEFSKIKILMYFKLFIDFVEKCHEKNLTLGFIHPKLVFVSRISGFQLIDYNFSELISEINFSKIYPLNFFFGIFDIDLLSNNDPSIKKICDINMLCLLLGYLFSYKYNDKGKYENYNIIVNSLQKDFITKNSDFSNFFSLINDKSIIELLSEILNVNVMENSRISRFKEILKKLIENQLKNIKCYTKNCESQNAKRFNFICEHMLCEECYKYHSTCNNSKKVKIIPENIDKEKTMFDSYLNIISKTKSLIPDISHKDFSKYFQAELSTTLKNIKFEKDFIQRYIAFKDYKLNSIITCLNARVKGRKKFLISDLVHNKKEIENEISSVNENPILKSKTKYLRKGTEVEKEKKKKSLLQPFANDLNEKINSETQDDNFTYFYEKFKKKMNKLIKLLSGLQIKNELNNTINKYISFEKLKIRVQKYLKYMKKEFIRDIDKQTKYFMDRLIELITKSLIDRNNLLNFYQLQGNHIVSTIDLRNNDLILYNLKQKNYCVNKIFFSEEFSPEPNTLLKRCSWVTFKDKIFVSGGVVKNKSGNEIISKRNFYIIFDEEKFLANSETNKEKKLRKSNSIQNDQLEFNAVKLTDMITERCQHCLIKVNDYYFMAISGFNTEKCELYSILNNEWTEVSSLPKAIYNSSATIFNEIDVYLFFGIEGKLKELLYNEEIYKFSLCSDDCPWVVINYSYDDKIKLSLHSTIVKNNKTILILGGKLTGENMYSNSILEFDVKNKSIDNKKKGLNQRVCFLESCFVKLYDEEYATFTSTNYLLKIDPSKII